MNDRCRDLTKLLLRRMRKLTVLLVVSILRSMPLNTIDDIVRNLSSCVWEITRAAIINNRKAIADAKESFNFLIYS
jgi:hypothetical protein